MDDIRDHCDLLSDNEFQRLLAAKIDVQHGILRYSLADLDDDLDEVILMLQAEMDE